MDEQELHDKHREHRHKRWVTTIHINAWAMAGILGIIQGIILWRTNGVLTELLLRENDPDKLFTLGVIFAPTFGIVAVMKTFAKQPPD